MVTPLKIYHQQKSLKLNYVGNRRSKACVRWLSYRVCMYIRWYNSPFSHSVFRSVCFNEGFPASDILNRPTHTWILRKSCKNLPICHNKHVHCSVCDLWQRIFFPEMNNKITMDYLLKVNKDNSTCNYLTVRWGVFKSASCTIYSLEEQTINIKPQTPLLFHTLAARAFINTTFQRLFQILNCNGANYKKTINLNPKQTKNNKSSLHMEWCSEESKVNF